MNLQVGFYPFRGPEASLTLFQAYHTAREVLLPPGREAWIDWHSSGLTGKQEVIRPETKAGFTVLPTLDGDNWRNQGSAAPKIAGEVVKSSWLRIQSANCVFGLTLTKLLSFCFLAFLLFCIAFRHHTLSDDRTIGLCSGTQGKRKKGKGQSDFSDWPLLMPATTYSPTHFRVQYNRPSGA